MHFRAMRCKDCKEGDPFRLENTHLRRVRGTEVDVTLRTTETALPGVPETTPEPTVEGEGL